MKMAIAKVVITIMMRMGIKIGNRKSIENEEKIMTITMTKTIIRKIMDFRLWFSLQGFRVLYFILSEFPTKDVSKCIINPTYLIGCCDSTLINLVFLTFLLIFNTTHKMGCCEYCY